MKIEIVRLKFPMEGGLLCAFLRAAVDHPQSGYKSQDVTLGDTDKDGWTPIFANVKDGGGR